jgi:hypothetical protein
MTVMSHHTVIYLYLDILGIRRQILFGKVYTGRYSVQKFGKSIYLDRLDI